MSFLVTARPVLVRNSFATGDRDASKGRQAHHDGGRAGSALRGLCAGLRGYRSPLGGISLGGSDLIDLPDARPQDQIPVTLTVDGPEGELRAAYNDAFWAEPAGNGALHVYFMTETRNQSDLVAFEAKPWGSR